MRCGAHAAPVTVEDMAASVHMGASPFHQQFKAVTSLSPLQYQQVLVGRFWRNAEQVGNLFRRQSSDRQVQDVDLSTRQPAGFGGLGSAGVNPRYCSNRVSTSVTTP
jgi:hypothetical protein